MIDSLTRNSALALLLVLCLSVLAQSGATEMNELMSARESGLLTDWRIVGPFGLHPATDFDRQWAPERDYISKPSYGSRKVEFFQFADGQVKLPPDHLTAMASSTPPRRCIFIPQATGAFSWSLRGTLAVFIDGQKVLTRDDRQCCPTDKSAKRHDAVARRSPRSGQISQWCRAFSPGDHGSHRRTAASSEHSEFHASDRGTPPPRCTTGNDSAAVTLAHVRPSLRCGHFGRIAS